MKYFALIFLVCLPAVFCQPPPRRNHGLDLQVSLDDILGSLKETLGLNLLESILNRHPHGNVVPKPQPKPQPKPEVKPQPEPEPKPEEEPKPVEEPTPEEQPQPEEGFGDAVDSN